MSSIFYYAFLFLWGITKGIDIGIQGRAAFICMVLGGICWFLKIVTTSYSRRQIITNIGLMLLGAVSYLMIHRLGVLTAVMIIIGAEQTNYKSALKVLLLLQVLLLLSRIVPEIIRVSQGEMWSGLFQERKVLGIWGGSQQYRMSLGFYHPNELYKTIFLITAFAVSVYLDQLKAWQLTILFVLNLSVYFVTFSNTALAIEIVFFVMILGTKNNRNSIIWLTKNGQWIFSGTVFLIIAICILYSKDRTLLEKINHFLTGRVRWANAYIKAVGFSIWGRSIENADVPYKGLDCGYVHILLRYGIAVLGTYCVMGYQLLKKMSKKNCYAGIALLLSLNFFFVTENFLMIAFQNCTWLMIGAILFSEYGQDHEKEKRDSVSLYLKKKLRKEKR